MTPHHERAIQAARLGLTNGDDPRVVTFAKRIVAEQTPELRRLQQAASSAHLTLDLRAGAAMATNRISDSDLEQLSRLRGRPFDLQFLRLHIASEQGAAAMARIELAHGHDKAARALATAIARAPSSEIPQLQALRSALA